MSTDNAGWKSDMRLCATRQARRVLRLSTDPVDDEPQRLHVADARRHGVRVRLVGPRFEAAPKQNVVAAAVQRRAGSDGALKVDQPSIDDFVLVHLDQDVAGVQIAVRPAGHDCRRRRRRLLR